MTTPAASATIDRTQGLPVAWNGGNPGSYVIITGTSVAGGRTAVGFTCMAPATAGQFTVPSYILSALPAGNGGVEVQNSVSAPLSATGLDIATAIGDISYSTTVTFK